MDGFSLFIIPFVYVSYKTVEKVNKMYALQEHKNVYTPMTQVFIHQSYVL